MLDVNVYITICVTIEIRGNALNWSNSDQADFSVDRAIQV